MAQVGQLDFRRFVETRKGPEPRASRRGGARPDRGHAYAYVSDRTTRMAFTRMKPVELAVTAAVRLFKAVGKNQLLGNAVRVGPNQFPRVHKLVTQCADTLGITPPTLYITNNPMMNAMTFGTNDDSFIIVNSSLIDYFTDDELLSVIGHEAGHIHNSHVVYLTALFYLRHMASVFLKWIVYPAELALSGWMRRAEITCDRAGLLCCKDVEVSRLALAKLALGSTKLHDELNVEAFAEQYEEGKAGAGRYAEMTAEPPLDLQAAEGAQALRRERALPAARRRSAAAGSPWSRWTRRSTRSSRSLSHPAGRRLDGSAPRRCLSSTGTRSPPMLESFHQKRDEVISTLRDLMHLAERVGARSLGAHLGADLVKKLEADRFHLVVVGEFNHGKSTFVNALLGANVLPVGRHAHHRGHPPPRVLGRAPRRRGLRLGEARAAPLRAGAHVLGRRRARPPPLRGRAAGAPRRRGRGEVPRGRLPGGAARAIASSSSTRQG